MKLTIIAQYHPAAALHQPRLWADMLEDWQHLPEKVPSDFRVASESEFEPDVTPIMSIDTEKDNLGGLGHWSVAFRDRENKLAVVPFYGKRRIEFGCPLVMHNAKYDLRVMHANDMREGEMVHDTMIAAYCLGLGKQAPKEDSKSKSGSNMVGGLGLKYLARRHLGMQMQKWDDVKDKPELVPEYNMKDSVATLLLFEKWRLQLPKHYFDIDMPLLKVLMAMEDRGVKIDPDYLIEFGKELDAQLASFDLPINPFATQDMQSYIYGALEIEPWKFTDTGAPSVEEEVLETIPDELVKKCLEYKHLYKEKGTYVDNYIKAADPNNRIHAEIKQTSTSTGRLSMARPNLQNVFKRDDRVKLRSLFCAEPGKVIGRLDFNQLDFRTLAAITQDPILIKALNDNKKIHQVTADELDISYDVAKTVNFATMFKGEAWALSQRLHITIGEARAFINRYFEKFPNIKKYQDEMEAKIRAEKKVTIPWTNRTRRIDAMFTENWRIQQEGIKEGINMPVQGLEAEVVKIVMIDLHYKHSAPMILQVHDELLFELPEKDAKDYMLWLRDYVPTIVSFGGVKFTVEVGLGKNWYEAGLKDNSL